MSETPAGSRTVDEARLRYLARVIARLRAVRGVSPFPSNKQETLVAHLDEQ